MVDGRRRRGQDAQAQARLEREHRGRALAVCPWGLRLAEHGRGGLSRRRLQLDGDAPAAGSRREGLRRAGAVEIFLVRL